MARLSAGKSLAGYLVAPPVSYGDFGKVLPNSKVSLSLARLSRARALPRLLSPTVSLSLARSLALARSLCDFSLYLILSTSSLAPYMLRMCVRVSYLSSCSHECTYVISCVHVSNLGVCEPRPARGIREIH